MNASLLIIAISMVVISGAEEDLKLKKWLKYCIHLPAKTYDPVCCIFVGMGCPSTTGTQKPKTKTNTTTTDSPKNPRVTKQSGILTVPRYRRVSFQQSMPGWSFPGFPGFPGMGAGSFGGNQLQPFDQFPNYNFNSLGGMGGLQQPASLPLYPTDYNSLQSMMSVPSPLDNQITQGHHAPMVEPAQAVDPHHHHHQQHKAHQPAHGHQMSPQIPQIPQSLPMMNPYQLNAF